MPSDRRADPRLSDKFARALELALEVHRHQARKGTRIPYISHPMSVAALVLEHGGDEETAIAALLHDTVEDAKDGAAVRDRIEAEFGPGVVRIVEGCSDALGTGREKPPWRERKEKYLAHLEEADRDVLLVALCDKVHNARAVLADYRVEGDRLFVRFNNTDPIDHLWYYSKLVRIFQRSEHRTLVDDLARTVSELTRLVLTSTATSADEDGHDATARTATAQWTRSKT